MVVPKVDHDCVLQEIVADLANRSPGSLGEDVLLLNI
jgi:hypothetical protein